MELRSFKSNETSEDTEEGANLIEYLYVLYQSWRFLVLICVFGMTIVALLDFVRPRVYEATATIRSEDEGGGGFDLKAALLKQVGMVMPSASATSGMAALLSSKQLREAVCVRYNINFMGNGENFVLLPMKKGEAESITVQASDPVMAADLANTFVLEVDRYNRTKMSTSAKHLRQYVTERLALANEELEKIQEAFREFQEENRAISITTQAAATLDVLSSLEAKRLALEIEMTAKEKFYKGPHQEIERLTAEMEAMQKNIDRLTYSREDQVPMDKEGGEVEFYIPLTRLPSLNFDESRFLLRVRAKTEVVALLTTQLEMARLDEAKDNPTINVLDWAEPPDRAINDRPVQRIVLAGLVGLFAGIFLVFLFEYTKKLGLDPKTSAKWSEIRSGFSGPFRYFQSKGTDLLTDNGDAPPPASSTQQLR